MTKPIILSEDMIANPDKYNGWSFDDFCRLVGDDAHDPTTPRTVMAKLIGVNRKTLYKMLEKLFNERGY